VRIFANTGALHNEFMAHRLSMIPLCFDADEIYDLESAEKGKEETAQLRFVLDKRNTGREPLHVTTRDFVIYARDGTVLDDADRERILPADPVTGDHVLITTLRPHPSNPKEGEHLHVECRPVIGVARDHAAWCPVSMCTFENKMDEAAAEAGFLARLEELRAERGRDLSEPEVAEYRARFFIMDAKRFFVKDESGEPTAFVFRLESECALAPELLVFRGLHILRDKLRRHRQQAVQTDDDGMMQVVVQGEGHTFGNLWQALTYSAYTRAAAKQEREREQELDFVGYYVPHPLEERVVLKMHSPVGGEPAAADALFAQTCDGGAAYLDGLVDEWLTVSKLSNKVPYVAEALRARKNEAAM
jgi:DNA-directed RNA polymerase subunit L